MSIDKRRLSQRGQAAPHLSRRGDAIRKALLAAGPLSSLLYVVATDVAASRWDGYRSAEQMVSGLFAVGSPGRDVLLPFTWLHAAVHRIRGGRPDLGARQPRSAHRRRPAHRLRAVEHHGALYPLTLGDEASIPMHIVTTNVQHA